MWELLTGDEPYSDMHCASIIGEHRPMSLSYLYAMHSFFSFQAISLFTYQSEQNYFYCCFLYAVVLWIPRRLERRTKHSL